MNNKIYIVAGNNNEFLCYVKRKVQEGWDNGDTSINMSNYVYVSRVDQLRGLSEINGFYIGTYKERSDINDIRLFIEMIKTNAFQSRKAPILGVLYNERRCDVNFGTTV